MAQPNEREGMLLSYFQELPRADRLPAVGQVARAPVRILWSCTSTVSHVLMLYI